MSTPKVLTPIKIKNVELKNRIICPSICTYFAEPDGTIGDQFFEFVRARVKGGVGAITVGGTPHGKPSDGRPAMSDDKYIPRWHELAEMVHSYGAKLICQLHPSKIQAGRGTAVMAVEEYSKELIKELVNSYAECARRCKEAGVDMVEIHGGHAHEVAQFMSPYYNKRTDEYGGIWKNRVRFSTEIVSAIKAKCGEDYPLIFCISGSEMTPGGRDIYETALMAQELVKAGADVIHVSCGMPLSDHYSCAPMDVPDCFNVENARIVKEAVSVPVVAVDKIPTLEQANEVLENGDADIVAMARPMLADPELVNKYAGINPEPPRLCLACDEGCRDMTKFHAIRCLQNPMLGREASLKYEEASDELKAKKIFVVGAGPAGLEAACVLARRGLKPVVLEAAGCAGGLMSIATIPPHKENMHRIAEYRMAFLTQKGIEARFNTKVDEAFLSAEKPDIIVDATGSKHYIPNIEGIHGDNIYTADDVLNGLQVEGQHIAVLGAGIVGAEVADFLSEKGKSLEIFDSLGRVADDFNKARRWFLVDRLNKAGVIEHMNSKILKVALPEIVIETNGETVTIGGFDAAVTALGRVSNRELSDLVKDKFPDIEFYQIGDAVKSATAVEATASAALTAASIK